MAPLKKEFFTRLILPSIAVAVFVTFTLDLLAQLFLVDIAQTFAVSRGVASRIQLVSSVTAVIFALLMSALSIRFKYKSLLIFGVLAIAVGALGCSLAPNFVFMQVFFPLNGIGSVMVIPMAFALIGETYPLDKRAKAIGWITAAGGSAAFIAVPAMGLIAQFGTWRSSLLLFVLPVSVAGLVLAFFTLPSARKRQLSAREAYLSSYRQVLLNRSAITSLVGSMLHAVVPVMGTVFGIAFFRDIHSLSLNFGIGILLGFAVFYVFGGWVAGRIINKFGRKSMTIATVLLEGICTILFVTLPSFPVALSFAFLAPLFGGMAATSIHSFLLEQVPESRGTMMSLNSAFANFGVLLGVGAGGVLLDGFGYSMLGLTLGAMGIVSAGVFYFLSRERIESHKEIT